MAMNNEIVYDYNMDSVYQPSLLPEDIQRSLAIYQEHENHREFASLMYEYSSNGFTEGARARRAAFNFNPYVINLKENNTPCVLYHMRSSYQTRTNLAPRSNGSFDIRIHNEKQNPNVELGDEISFDRPLNSFTYSNNYPLLGNFATELQRITFNPTYDFIDIFKMEFTKLIPHLYEYLETLPASIRDNVRTAVEHYLDFDDNQKDQYLDLDDDPDEYENFRGFAKYYKNLYGTKLSDDLNKNAFIAFINDGPIINDVRIPRHIPRACFFIITATTGIVLKPFAIFPEQDEILGTRGVRYRVTSVRDGLVKFSDRSTDSGSYDAFMHIPFICENANQVERVRLLDRHVIAASDTYTAFVDVIEMEEI